ncbi:hypothetical protein G7Y89_g9484 [Cudoniella acicularis]|uniref:Rhodopsin domain-containing protein n=1 Tax=Cudoniella acicularis TaxID=354080 RepID=A0A8H4REK4_9HELO|nr:hypothetical protein G7Y89_g9484 [Cudoniella acicularis]
MTTPSSQQFPPGYLEEYKGAAPVAVSITFIVLEIFFVALRFWARYIGRVKWGLDDFLMVPARYSASLFAAAGAGYHEAAVAMSNPKQLILFLKFQLLVPIAYFAAVLFPKLAILGLYLRIFNQKIYRTAAWTIGVVMTANWIGATVAALFMCQPLSYLWDRTIPGGHCFDIANFFRWGSFMNILTDVAMLVLPLPTIWTLKTSRNIRIGLTVTFAMGSLGLITSILRFVGFFDSNAVIDAPWAAAPLIIWTDVETGTYLIAACLPTYRSLAVSLWKRNPLTHVGYASKVSANSNAGRDDIPLERRNKAGFERFDNNSDELLTSQQSVNWVSSPGTTGRGMKKMPLNGIIVERQIDVV